MKIYLNRNAAIKLVIKSKLSLIYDDNIGFPDPLGNILANNDKTII